ncbi:hypothetical protein DL98DRAFT_522358 [Cadophora sp. DSE1049]|nr:hypothetical protein DL98DRAFT_522358 [Cadophora sp. DSE1049]
MEFASKDILKISPSQIAQNYLTLVVQWTGPENHDEARLSQWLRDPRIQSLEPNDGYFHSIRNQRWTQQRIGSASSSIIGCGEEFVPYTVPCLHKQSLTPIHNILPRLRWHQQAVDLSRCTSSFVALCQISKHTSQSSTRHPSSSKMKSCASYPKNGLRSSNDKSPCSATMGQAWMEMEIRIQLPVVNTPTTETTEGTKRKSTRKLQWLSSRSISSEQPLARRPVASWEQVRLRQVACIVK